MTSEIKINPNTCQGFFSTHLFLTIFPMATFCIRPSEWQAAVEKAHVVLDKQSNVEVINIKIA